MVFDFILRSRSRSNFMVPFYLHNSLLLISYILKYKLSIYFLTLRVVQILPPKNWDRPLEGEGVDLSFQNFQKLIPWNIKKLAEKIN